MEIYITGDTHGDFRRFQPEIFYEQESLTKEDIVLVCGDFGGECPKAQLKEVKERKGDGNPRM